MDAIYELKRQMMFLERAHASARMGHFVLDPKRKTVEFSSWVRDNLGLNDMPIPIDRLREFIPEEEREEFADRIAALITSETDFSFEMNIITAKGLVRTQRVSGIPAFENEPRREGLIGYYGILQEITKEKEAQRSLVAARDEARSELTARTNILAAVSHEIRTPLGGVLGIIDQLKRENSVTERERAIGLIEDSCRALLDTLDAMLQQARLSQDADAREVRRFRPGSVAQRVAELFRPLARRKAIRIEVHAASNVEAMGDPGRIQQVLANLVSNSVKFTQSGAVTLYVQQPTEHEKRWVFVVSDTGPGLPASRIGSIFDRFDTSGEDSLGRAVGAGLGLSITRDIVNALDGEIEVESEVGKGTSFSVFVPLGKAVEDENDVADDSGCCQVLVVAQKATQQIQAEAVASQAGWSIAEPGAALPDQAAPTDPFVIVCDEPSLQSLSDDVLAASSRIILLVEAGEGTDLNAQWQEKIIHLPIGSMSRSLPDTLRKVIDDCA